MAGKRKAALVIGFNADLFRALAAGDAADWRFQTVRLGGGEFVRSLLRTLGGARAVIVCSSPSPLLLLAAARRGARVYFVWSDDAIEEAARHPHATALFARRAIRHVVTTSERADALRALGIIAICARFDASGDVARLLDEDARAFVAHSESPARNERRVAVSGFDYFVADMVGYGSAYTPGWRREALDLNSRSARLFALLRFLHSDVWYTIGANRKSIPIELLAFVIQKPRVMHWVGSDIEMLASKRLLQLFWHLRRFNVVHLAEIDWTAKRLASLGLPARILPLPARLCCAPLKPLPQRFTALLYVPNTRAEFYGAGQYERLIRAMDGKPVDFIVVGGGKLDVPVHAPVRHVGWQSEMTPLYDSSSVLIRFTETDGLSMMVLEALARGRHVIWRKSFPHVQAVVDYDDLECAFRALLASHSAGTLAVQHDAARDTRERYDAQRTLGEMSRVWETALGR